MERKKLAIRLSLFAGVAAAIISVGISRPATAAEGVTCPAVATPPGPLTYTAAQPLSGGGTAYYFCISGIVNELPEAPATFDPLTATSAQLAEYGLPPRPADAASLATWQTEMASWRPHTGTPSLVLGDSYSEPDGPTPDTLCCGGGSDYPTPSWSGWLLDASSNTWKAVEGDFSQPPYSLSSCTNEQLASWVGIGGFNGAPNTAFLQTGTSAASSTYDAAWYMYFNSNGVSPGPVTISGITIRPGDHIHEYVSYNTSTNKAEFYVHDYTTGSGQPVLVPLGSSYWDGTSAEWIDERPSPNQTLSHLEKYGTNNWYSLQGQKTNGTWVAPDAWPDNILIAMVDSSNYILSVPTSWSTSSFTDTWERCN